MEVQRTYINPNAIRDVKIEIKQTKKSLRYQDINRPKTHQEQPVRKSETPLRDILAGMKTQ